MQLVSCKKCGAKVSDQYSYCINCQAPLNGSLESRRGPKHKAPSDTRQGALVGAFIGLIYGIGIATIGYFIMLPLVFSALSARIMESPEALVLPTVWNIMIAVVVVFVPIMTVIAGTILGVLFIALRQRLPGSTIMRKSVAFSLILVAIDFLFIGLTRFFRPNNMTNVFDKGTLAVFYSLQVVSYAVILVEFPLLGCLFGYLLSGRIGHK